MGGRPGCRRSGAKRKATPDVSIWRDAKGPGAVEDPEHARTHLTREPGDLTLVFYASEYRYSPHREVSGHTPVMNEREKSDSLVVPEKPPNKAEEPAAEGVEGSELAKGRTLGCNAFRTQSRGDAHSTLERIRQVAREGDRQQFTALLHHVFDVDRLRDAYYALRRDAAAGVDGETWQHYGRRLGDKLPVLSCV